MAESTFEFVPPLGVWTLADSDTVNHETGHAVVALWLGIVVEVARIDRPGDHAGHVIIDIAGVGDFELLLFAIVGYAGELRPMQWPPNPKVEGDERNAARLVARLGFDEQAWDDAHELVADIRRQPEVRRAGDALARALLERGALACDQVHDIWNAATTDVA